MEKKLTKRDHFKAILALDAVKADAGLTAFVEHEPELLERKAKADRKETPKQAFAKALGAEIVEFLAGTGKAYTVGELIKSCPAVAAVEDISTSRVTSILTALKKDGKVEQYMEKRKSYYKVAGC